MAKTVRRTKTAPAGTSRAQHKRPPARYTPPSVGRGGPSSSWLVVFMIGAFLSGVVIDMTGYFALRAGATQIAVLGLGAALFIAGLVAATRYR